MRRKTISKRSRPEMLAAVRPAASSASGSRKATLAGLMELLTLTEVRRRAQAGAVDARVHVQVDSAAGETTRDGKPFCKLMLADAADRMTLRVWNDHPDYKACDSLQPGDFIELSGAF